MQEHGKIYVHYSTLNIHRYRSLCNKEQRQSTAAIKLKEDVSEVNGSDQKLQTEIFSSLLSLDN